MKSEKFQVFFRNYIQEYPRLPFEKIRALDLAVLYIYDEVNSKPFKLNKKGQVDYYNKFYAVDKKGNELQSVLSLDKNVARQELLQTMNTKTKKYQDWEKNHFTIRYEPGQGFEQKYILSQIQQDFPHIEKPFNYLCSIVDEFDKFLPDKKKR